MKLGKIFLIVVLVFATAIGIATIQDFSFDESQPVSVVDDSSPQIKTIKVGLSDGIGSGDNG